MSYETWHVTFERVSDGSRTAEDSFNVVDPDGVADIVRLKQLAAGSTINGRFRNNTGQPDLLIEVLKLIAKLDRDYTTNLAALITAIDAVAP